VMSSVGKGMWFVDDAATAWLDGVTFAPQRRVLA
jgi:hypothetical protein